MKPCTCCGAPRAMLNPRPYVTAWIYQLYAECTCGSTFAVTLWEADEDPNEEAEAA